MKKMLILLGLSLLMCLLAAEDFMQPAQIAKDSYNPGMRFGIRNVSRDQDPAPEYFFIPNGDGEDTTNLISSYYDYMPFSYNGHNLRKQPDISQPYGYPAGGWYLTYMRSETQSVSTDRRAYYSYLNPDGTLGESNGINYDPDIREGFPSCAVDPYTGDAFVAWHSVTEPDNSYDSNMSYTLFHATGSAGSWRTPFILIDNPEMSIPFTGHYDDEFIWPQVWIGPSPEAGHRRAHAYGNMYPSSVNCLYLYADFDDSDIIACSDLDWTVTSFPYLDNMHYNDIARVTKDMVVSEDDGKVVFFGSVADSLIAFYSDDYGETFTRYTQQLKQQMDNPPNYQTGQFIWENDDGTPSDMYILPSHDLSHYNAVFTDNNTKVQWMSGVNYNSQENIDDGEYWPAYIYPKIFTFDTVTHEFSFYDVDVQDTDPADDHMAVAFDLDDDGEVDEYDIFGWPIVVMSAPSWFFNSDFGWQDAYFHESNCKMVANGDWVVAAWHDGAKLQNAYYGEEGYDGWFEQPEIAIIISDDGGATWSDIRYINANPNDNVIDPANHYDGNYAPEFAGMLPVNISLGDKLEILNNSPGNYHAKLNFVFMDDGDYGSAVGPCTNNGDLTNNPLRYAAIDLEFGGAPIILVADFIADILSGDTPLTVNFTDLSTGYPTTWEWDFDNDGTIDSYEQNPTYIYSEAGLYTVSLTVSDGINEDIETKVDYITVGEPIIANFEADPLFGLVPLDVQFTDLSSGGLDIFLNLDENTNTPSKINSEKKYNIDSSREIVSWEWDFNNDGAIDSYEQNPAHTYTVEGMYTVVLTVSDGTNTNTETKVNYITVGLISPTNLTADLDEVTGEVDLNWNYGTESGFYEDFEDGVADNWVPVNGNWNVSSGIYSATLNTTASGSSYYDEDFSNFEYEVRLRNAYGSGNVGINFNGDPSILTYSGAWSNTYQLVYYQDGGWNLLLKVDGDFITIGEGTSSDLNLGAGEWNIIKIVFSAGYMDVYFNDILQGTYFDDTYSTGKVALRLWNSEADYDYASLSPIDNGYSFGEINQSEYRNIYSNIIDNCKTETGSKIIGKVKSSIPNYGRRYTYRSNTENRDFQHFKVYRDASVIGTTTDTFFSDDLPEQGTYEYEVTAFYDEGESEPIGPVEVIWEIEPLVSDFEADPIIGLLPLNVQFTDLSTGGFSALLRESGKSKFVENENSREIVSWEWDFDNDGIIDSYEQNPTYTYSNAGLYTVSLTVSDGINEDTEIKVDYITVGEPIIANFEADPLFGLAPHNVQFTDLSSGGLDIILDQEKNVNKPTKTNSKKMLNMDNSREIVSWEWDFNNDGTIDSYEQNPAHTYTVEGMYTVVLTVSDGINTNTEAKVDYITVGLIPPTDLTADLNEVTGEVDLNWNYGTGNGFYEDFEDGVADNWTPVDGNWSVSGGSYNVASSTYEVSTSYFDEDFSNFEYEARLRKTSGSESVVGICFNGEPIAGGNYGDWQNTYQLHYTTYGDWTLFKNVNWNYTFIQEWTTSPDLNTGMGSWNKMKVIFADGNIDVYFNDVLQGTYYDNTFLFGKVGLLMFDSNILGTAEFDYVSLTEITEGYTFGPVSQSKYRDVYSMDSQNCNDPDLPGTIIGQELAPVPPYEGQYTYQPDTESRDLQYFKVYRNGSVIGTTMATSYTDDLPEIGTYEYEVTAYYDEGESEPVGPVYVEWLNPPDISVSPTSLSETLQVDETSTQYLTIANNGESDLVWQINLQFHEYEYLNADDYVPENVCNYSLNKIGAGPNSQLRPKPNIPHITPSSSFSRNFLHILILETTSTYNSAAIEEFALNIENFEEVELVTLFYAGDDTPTTELMSNYDLVIFTTDALYQDMNTTCENVVTYIDEGGKVILTTFAWADQGNNTIVGTLLEQYSPFQINNESLYSFAELGDYIEDHPIFENVNEFSSFFRDNVTLSENANLIASWSDDHLFIAEKGMILGINSALQIPYPEHVNGWQGDGWELIHNAILYMTNSLQNWLNISETSGTISSGSSNVIDVIFDSADLELGTYEADILISSNDPDDPLVTVPVTLEVIDEVEPLISDFEADPLTGLLPLNVQFTDLSTGGLPGLLGDSTNKSNSKIVENENSREIISWEWDFNNDGIIDSYTQNPTFTYNQIGVYSVTLTVSDGTNEDTEIKVDYITVSSVSGDDNLLPINTQLYSNHPNPFNPLTTISFDIKNNESGTLTLFNIKGQIIESHQFKSGKHNYLWDASNQASGIYFYKLQTQTTNEIRKMLLLK